MLRLAKQRPTSVPAWRRWGGWAWRWWERWTGLGTWPAGTHSLRWSSRTQSVLSTPPLRQAGRPPRSCISHRGPQSSARNCAHFARTSGRFVWREVSPPQCRSRIEFLISAAAAALPSSRAAVSSAAYILQRCHHHLNQRRPNIREVPLLAASLQAGGNSSAVVKSFQSAPFSHGLIEVNFIMVAHCVERCKIWWIKLFVESSLHMIVIIPAGNMISSFYGWGNIFLSSLLLVKILLTGTIGFCLHIILSGFPTRFWLTEGL